MKYIRFISNNDEQNIGILNSDNTIELIEGDILGKHKPNGIKCNIDDIKEYMVPVGEQH